LPLKCLVLIKCEPWYTAYFGHKLPTQRTFCLDPVIDLSFMILFPGTVK